MVQTVYVYLPKERVDVWAPVDAEHVHDDVYRLVGRQLDNQAPEFARDELVRCRLQRLSGGDCLVAFERAS